MLNVTVVDAQGGGLGAAVIKSLCESYKDRIRILALGTNAAATAAMKKSGACECATGENAIIYNIKSSDVIIGGVGIIASSGMLGEITPLMAKAISESPATKILIPISRCSIIIAGTEQKTIKELIDSAVSKIAVLL